MLEPGRTGGMVACALNDLDMGGPSSVRGFSFFGTITELLLLLRSVGLSGGFWPILSLSDCDDSGSESITCRLEGGFLELVLEGESSTSLLGALTLG